MTLKYNPTTGLYARKTLPDGTVVSLEPLTFGRARITLGFRNDMWEQGY